MKSIILNDFKYDQFDGKKGVPLGFWIDERPSFFNDQNHQFSIKSTVLFDSCVEAGCMNIGLHSIPGHQDIKLCSIHRTQDMLSWCSKKCMIRDCNQSATHNFEGDNVPTFCFEHKIAGMVSVLYNKRLKCKIEKCSNMAYYNYKGKLKALFCEEHKSNHMIAICSDCEIIGCLKPASFGFYNDNRVRYCLDHKTDGMVNLKFDSSICSNQSCTCPGLYFLTNGLKACAHHKSEETFTLVKCARDGCEDMATFNYQGSKVGVVCYLHRAPKMIDITDVSYYNTQKLGSKTTCCRCLHEGCMKIASVNFENETRPKFCSKHRLKGMVSTASRRCTVSGCFGIPYFNFKGQRAHYCAEHQADGMKMVRQKYYYFCDVYGCLLRPSFNKRGEQQARYCELHKTEGMERAPGRFCSHPDCNFIKATCNFKGEKIPEVCAKHKSDSMVTIVWKKLTWDDIKKRCEQRGCDREPCFNYPKEKGKRFCSRHKLDGMIDIKNRQCEADGCWKRASFKFKGAEGAARFCGKHKLLGMVLNKKTTPQCGHADCTKTPSFGYDGQGPAKVCGRHKADGMINLKRFKTCKEEGCLMSALYGLSDDQQGPKYCLSHKRSGMICLRDMKHCITSNCSAIARYNFHGKKCPRYCVNHKMDGMVTVCSERKSENRKVKSGINSQSTKCVPKNISHNKKQNTKKCYHDFCTHEATYNFRGKRKGVLCEAHRMQGMVEVAESVINMVAI